MPTNASVMARSPVSFRIEAGSVAGRVRILAVSGGPEVAAGARHAHRADTGAPGSRGFLIGLACIVAAGIVVRVLYTVLVAPWPPGLPDDQVYFNLMPGLLADGHGFAQPLLATRGEFRPTAAHPPLYPLVLAVPAELGVSGQVAQRLTGTLFGAGTIVVIALIARRLAGQTAGLVAAGLAALYPILVTADVDSRRDQGCGVYFRPVIIEGDEGAVSCWRASP